MITISVKQLANAVNTCTRIVPLRVVHTLVLGEEYWLISEMRDNVKLLFPCHWFTSTEAVQEYCKRNDIDPENIITEYKEA